MKISGWAGTALISILLSGFVPLSPALAQDSTFCGRTYTIQSGDTLSLLAIRAFGDVNAFLRFYEDSRNTESLGSNPNRISAGAPLYLPLCADGGSTSLGDGPTAETPPNQDPFAETIDVVTGTDFAPFTDEDLQNGGMLTTVVQEAFNQSGLDQAAKIVFINDWGSHLDNLIPDKKYEFGFPWYKPDCNNPSALSPDMRKRCDLVWSDPLFSVTVGFYTLATASNLPSGFDDLNGKHLCRPTGYFTFDLEERGLIPGETIKLSQPGSVSDCFDLLVDGSVDFVTINRFTAEKAIAREGYDGLIIPISTAVTTQDLHMVGHQGNPRAARLIREFNRGLKNIEDSGRLFRITNFFINEHIKEIERLRNQR